MNHACQPVGRIRKVAACRRADAADHRTAGLGPAAVNVLALAGAALIIISAIIHLHLWAQGYRSITVIGSG